QLLATLRTERLEAEIAAARARIRAQQAIVAALENGSRPQEIEQAEAGVAAAEAVIRLREREIARLEASATKGATSVQTLDDARARLEVERAELRVRVAALELLVEGPRQEDIARARAELDALSAELAL